MVLCNLFSELFFLYIFYVYYFIGLTHITKNLFHF